MDRKMSSKYDTPKSNIAAGGIAIVLGVFFKLGAFSGKMCLINNDSLFLLV